MGEIMMTDKEQIIIDGVDVSKCRYFCIYDDLCRDDNIGRVVRPLCKRIPDCYFKLLARKTQIIKELEQLKKDYLLDHRDDNECTISIIQQIRERLDLANELEQECEKKEGIIENQRKEIRKYRCKLKELKNKLRTLDEETTTVEITEAEFAEYQSYKKQHQELIEVNNKRKEEIKTLKYMLYEERELCHETFKANFKIAKLERTINSNKSRFTYELNRYRNALEKIEGLVKNFCKDCGESEICNWKEGCYYSLIPNLKDIINKAKGKELL